MTISELAGDIAGLVEKHTERRNVGTYFHQIPFEIAVISLIANYLMKMGVSKTLLKKMEIL